MPDDAPTPSEPAFYSAGSYDATGSVGHLLNQVLLAMRRDIEQRLAAHDVTAAQWLPLWKLKHGNADTALELARQLAMDAGAVTRLVDRLEAKGLVARTRSEIDRRVVRLTLTAAGEDAVLQVTPMLAEVNNHFLRGFSLDEWQALKYLLRRMLANGAAPAPEAALPAVSTLSTPGPIRGPAG